MYKHSSRVPVPSIIVFSPGTEAILRISISMGPLSVESFKMAPKDGKSVMNPSIVPAKELKTVFSSLKLRLTLISVA